MISVVLRKTGKKDPDKEYALMIREYNGIDVDWATLCYMDHYSAHRLNGEEIYYWDGDAEEKSEVKALRLKNSALRKAWEQYQTLKALSLDPSK